MELSKKTTILFPPDLHRYLTRLAAQEGRSLGELVREACRAEYGFGSTEDRRRAVEELLALELPVGDPGTMKRQSVPEPADLLPAVGRSRGGS